MIDHLNKARAAIDDDDHAAALRHLLAAWQRVPARALADAIDAVGARAAEGLEPPSGKTPDERNARWTKLAKAGDPVIRGTLVASLTEINSFPNLMARIALLVAKPDPRVARRIFGLVEQPVFSATIARNAGPWRALWSVLPTLGDPQILERAGSLEKGWKKAASRNQQAALAIRLNKTLPALTAAYGGGVPELAAADRALVDAIAKQAVALSPKVVAGKRSEAELLAAVYAAPADDGPRAVYADFLQERGNPRGELIALQLAAKPTPASRARERALLAEYVARWIEPLEIDKASARFERGFVASCALGAQFTTAKDPAWSTVHTITNASSEELVALARRLPPLALRALRWIGPETPRSRLKEDRAAIKAFATLPWPTLRHLEVGDYMWLASDPKVTVKQMAWLLQARCVARLDELIVHMPPALATPVLAALAPTAIQRFEVCARHYNQTLGWRLSFERDLANAFTRLTIHVDPNPADWPHQQTWGEDVIAALPTLKVTSIRVVVAKRSAADWKRLKARLIAACGEIKPTFG